MTYFSVVIPLKDEEENVEELINEIEPVMMSLNKPWELLMVDDGSTDKTGEILANLAEEKEWLRPVTFDRNYGQSSAFDAGFKLAKGKFVITLDGDRQNDPQDIPKLVSLSEKYDLVCGQRVNRRDPFIKRVTSSIANFVRSRVCKDGMTDTGCSLKLYRTSCLKKLKLYDGMHRFLPALFQIEGFKVTQTPVNHREREKGKTKYNFFNRSFNTILDMWVVWWMRQRHINYNIRSKKT